MYHINRIAETNDAPLDGQPRIRMLFPIRPRIKLCNIPFLFTLAIGATRHQKYSYPENSAEILAPFPINPIN